MLFKTKMPLATSLFFIYALLFNLAIAQPKVKVTDYDLYKELEVSDKSFHGRVAVTMTPKTFISNPSITMVGSIKLGDADRSLAADAGLTIDLGPPFRIDFKSSLEIKFEQTTINLYEHVYLLAEGNEIIENYQSGFMVNNGDVKIVEVTNTDGCVFRLTPRGPVVARAFSGTQVVFLEDDVLHKGWIKVMVEKENRWVEAYVGKRLMSAPSGQNSSEDN